MNLGQLSKEEKSDHEFLDPDQVRTILRSHGYSYPKNAKHIAMLMCKGGVGKTTLSAFMGLRLACYGARVLFIDSDPQSNLTSLLQSQLTDVELNPEHVLVHVLKREVPVKKAIVSLTSHIDLLPSSLVNSLLEKELLRLKGNPIQRLGLVLSEVSGDYDFIITDCAPSLNIFNASVAYCSQLMLIPFQLSKFSEFGLDQTVSEIKDLETTFNFKTTTKAILNGYRSSDKLAESYLETFVEKHFDIMAGAVIRYSREIEKATGKGFDFFKDPRSQTLQDFDKLAIEIFLGTSLSGSDHARYQ